MPRIHIMNPEKKKRGRKRGAKRKQTTKKRTVNSAGAKPMAKKKRRSVKRRTTLRRKRNPSVALAKRAPASPRRRSRRRGPRRRNPSASGIVGGLLNDFKQWGPFFAGKLFTAWAVQKSQMLGLGNGQLLGGGVMNSRTGGSSWTLAQYGVGLVASHFGARLLGRFFNESEFRRGGRDLVFTKLMWTEVIGRSPWAQAQFGAVPRYDPSTGQTWLHSGNRSVAMQGLVEASPLDGMRRRRRRRGGRFAGLVVESPLDGYLPSTTPVDEAMRARWAGDGYTSPFNASYAGYGNGGFAGIAC